MLDICLTTSRGKSLTKIYAHTGGNSWANDLARLFAQLFPLEHNNGKDKGIQMRVCSISSDIWYSIVFSSVI